MQKEKSVINTIVFIICSVHTLQAQQLNIESLSLQYPNVYLPYYHYSVDIDIPYAAYLEATVYINGQKQRYFTLKDGSMAVDKNRTMIHYRPAFANTYTVENKKFNKPSLTGWLAWQQGKTYDITVELRLKKALQKSDNDLVLKGNMQVKGPANAIIFDTSWKQYKSVVLTETGGIERKREPVDITLAFYADEAKTLEKDLRVMEFDVKTKALTELPAQVYDISQDVIETDARDQQTTLYQRSTYEVPIWLPTTTARIAFQVDMAPRSSKIILLYHNNPSAVKPSYKTALTFTGPAPALTFDKESAKVRENAILIENNKVSIGLHPHSGVLNKVTLKSKPAAPFFHGMETNGALHWTPEVYAPPRPWTHTSDWMQPKFQAWRGPVVVTTLTNGQLPLTPEIDAAVSYKLYADLPYILTTTSARVNESIAVQAFRNGEMIFKRELITHVSWFDVIDNKIQTLDLTKIADLDEILMDERTPWISFFNASTGVGFGGIKLESSVAGSEHLPRIVNPYYYCIVGPTVYWSHAMNFTFASSASQLMIKVPKGTQLWEKWAYLPYEIKPGTDPHADLLAWEKRLLSPLAIRITEEVEQRVPVVGTEIYIDPSKTGWEGRETMKK